MAYRIIVSPRAQKEMENAIEYYALYSVDAPLNFVTILKHTYDILEKDPFLRIRYKNIRAIKIKRFPYLLYFVINETNNTVRVLSCFHSKRNPKKRPDL
ncbi:type II toxin-antitoxin system RelE/ParE family toxin [Mucilaginibacter sp.]|uniref:type II toxin-antitoxin system RelE/ParE family toxin n=1 Tax=Mucilaginibacter sp. TaxID=1882438 RepID=UPI00284CBB50|nr:type II toxin-antitoxin system RelE/ParE family toxin [Mucilaginibacter sp.]MDR3693912.1 type II toxin-antitoxin system RelE/ParE family toxin [Mucilaginibacter sp.]